MVIAPFSVNTSLTSEVNTVYIYGEGGLMAWCCQPASLNRCVMQAHERPRLPVFYDSTILAATPTQRPDPGPARQGRREMPTAGYERAESGWSAQVDATYPMRGNPWSRLSDVGCTRHTAGAAAHDPITSGLSMREVGHSRSRSVSRALRITHRNMAGVSLGEGRVMEIDTSKWKRAVYQPDSSITHPNPRQFDAEVLEFRMGGTGHLRDGRYRVRYTDYTGKDRTSWVNESKVWFRK